VKPYRGRPASRDRDGGSITRRQSSIASIPQVVSEKEKDRRKREKEEEKKHVDIDEHLMPHLAVAERYETRINMEKPAESLGLTDQKAEQLLREHGLNQLTPPKKRHPILKYLKCLSSLFNVLLILAGILEYILLGINYKDNFQNVSIRFGRGSGE
jgi:sodium/potassium-transporting ATPase subunit alpha